MPRAKRYFDSGQIWHITHRCHKKEFLLKFSRDRKRYIAWLYQATKRYQVKVLNYMVTSNHIHLIVINSKTRKYADVVSRSMQLIAGRMAQEYNRRKERKGAFWEDRYHATLIDTGSYLDQCMVYIDMNMVRAKVIKHPEEWVFCGFHELITKKSRFVILDVQSLMDLFSIQTIEELIKFRRFAVEEAIRKEQHMIRDEKWSESVAVGSRSFLEKTKKQNLAKCRGRLIDQRENLFVLGEEKVSYESHFTQKKAF